MKKAQPLTIKSIEKETPDAVSICLNVPEPVKADFQFHAGQYLNFEMDFDGTKVRRAYSLCSTSHSGDWCVAVKKVPGGTFSVFANERLQPGDQLLVFPPEGRFVFQPSPSQAKTYVAFAAGSGITPVFSILKTALEKEPESTFLLVYGNKTPESTIFLKQLMDLQEAHPGRFFLELVFSQSQLDHAQFGRISTSIVNYFLKNKYKHLQPSSYYICGPEGMITEVQETLLGNGVSKSNIHFELFTADEVPETTVVSKGNTSVTVILDEEETTFEMPQSSTVLEAVLKQDLDAPYSCQGGICSTCIARLKEGQATMRKNQILTDEEIEEGFILTCQAQPTSSTLTIDYDDI